MPTYTFQDKKTGKLSDPKFMKIAEMEQYLIDNPKLELAPASPLIVSGVASARNKPDEGFRDILRGVKKASGRNNTINTW